MLREELTGWLTVLTFVGGALWGLYEYQDDQDSAEKERLEQAKNLEKGRLAQVERENLMRREADGAGLDVAC